MGIILSTDLAKKLVGSYHPHQVQSGNSSSVWRDQLPEFMEGGGCKETYKAFQDCVEESENNNRESIGHCYPMLAKCMEAYSDYYQPLVDMDKVGEELFTKAFYASFLPSDQPMQGDAEEEAEKRYVAFMEGGCCKESFTAWDDCAMEAEKNNENCHTKCGKLYAVMSKCMDAHSDYYQPILTAKKTLEEHMEKEHQAFFS